MSFSDPQDLKVVTSTVRGASSFTLPRTSSAADFGQFKSSDGYTSFTISHQYAKRYRRVARLDVKAIVADPLLVGVNSLQSMSVYLVVDSPQSGFTQAVQKQYVDNLCDWLTNNSYANTVKLLGGES